MEISSIAQFSGLIENHFRDRGDTTVVYRGHGAASFKLCPKVGRHAPPKLSGRTHVNEALMLELFRRQSPDRIGIATTDDWEFLSIAQHHGMATRLLDWTRNPLAALYFAVCKKDESWDAEGRPQHEDAEIIAWRSPKVDLTKPPKGSPLKIKQVIKYVPRITTPRLRVQSGLFTVHPKPKEEFAPPGVLRIQIPYLQRKELKDSLYRHGLNESVLFPDVDGLARHIDWLQIDSY